MSSTMSRTPSRRRVIKGALAAGIAAPFVLRLSPAFGLTRMSNRAFVRFGISYELRGLR